MIADILLASGALGAAFYCLVLSRRLRRFTDLDSGMGGAVAVLSAQVDDMTRMLAAAQSQTETTQGSLGGLTDRAEEVARRLELLCASLHDLPVGAGSGAGAGASDGAGAAAQPRAAPKASETPDSEEANESQVREAEADAAFRKAAGQEGTQTGDAPTLIFRSRNGAGAAA